MFGATAKLARRLRDCRACGSRAIAGPYADDVDDETIELSVRCGECGTWRSEVMLFHRAGAVGSRLARGTRHGRRDIEDSLRRLRVGGVDSSDILRAPPWRQVG